MIHLSFETRLHFSGLENRPKDIGRFFFWMTVRGKDLDFLVANLSEEESAHEVEDIQVESTSESCYAKRKRKIEGAQSQQKLSDQKPQMALLKELMTTPETSSKASSSVIDDSVVQKNLASANEKKVNTLLKVMDNATVFALYTTEEQNQMKKDLKDLISNN